MNEHEHECLCGFCAARKKGLTEEQADEAYRIWEQEQMEKHGWYAHYVGADHDYPFHFQAHTHGLPHTYGHLDLQIVLPMDQRIVHSLFIDAIKLIKEGKTFEPDKKYRGIVKNYEVKFVLTQENERPILRMIIPDQPGNLDADTLTGDFARQYENLLPVSENVRNLIFLSEKVRNLIFLPQDEPLDEH